MMVDHGPFSQAKIPTESEECLAGQWQPIEAAPKDGSSILARIPGHGDDNVIAFVRGLDDADGPVMAWTFTTEQEPPEDWTDGWCWAVNEDGLPSTQPTHWKPMGDDPTVSPAGYEP